jgi:chromosome segregation ATPase
MSKKGDNEPATKGDVRRLERVVDKHNAKAEKKYASTDQRFDAVDRRFDAVDQRFDAVDRRFDAVEKDIKEMKGDILSLRLDNKDAKQERAEMMQELKLIHRSLLRLDERVRYQQDIPERVEQLEQDVYDLKRKIHNKAQVQ